MQIALYASVFVLFAASPAWGQRLIDCARINFSALDQCCAQPLGELATPQQLSNCNPQRDSKLNAWFNSYQLNKLQLPERANAVDIRERNTQTTLCSAASFLNCLTNDVVDPDGSLNMAALADYIDKNRPASDPWKARLQQHLENLGPLSNYIPAALSKGVQCAGASGVEKNVTLAPLLLIQLLQLGAVDLCPDRVPSTLANQCDETIAKWKSCQNALQASFFPAAADGATSGTRFARRNIFQYIGQRSLLRINN